MLSAQEVCLLSVSPFRSHSTEGLIHKYLMGYMYSVENTQMGKLPLWEE